jgi:hypothetical protein
LIGSRTEFHENHVYSKLEASVTFSQNPGSCSSQKKNPVSWTADIIQTLLPKHVHGAPLSVWAQQIGPLVSESQITSPAGHLAPTKATARLAVSRCHRRVGPVDACPLTRLDVGASRPFLSHRSGKQIRTRTQKKKSFCFVLAATRRGEARRGRLSDPSQSPHASFRFVWVLPPSILTRSLPLSPHAPPSASREESRRIAGQVHTRPSPSLVRIIVVGSVGFVAFDGITRSVVFAGFFCYFFPLGLDRSVGIWMQNVANSGPLVWLQSLSCSRSPVGILVCAR